MNLGGSPEELLRRAGLRATSTRVEVLLALAGLPGHPQADEVAAAVGPQAHRATVYRVLETFLEVGIVTHVHLPSGAVAYHLPRADEVKPHLHARCHDCGVVVDLPGDLLDVAAEQVLGSHGFTVDVAHIALSGRCRACSAAVRTSS